MTTFDRIKELADKQGKSLQKVASDLGFSPSYFYNLKSKKSPSAEHLAKVADYFHVTVDYLLGRGELSVHISDSDLSKMLEGAEAFNGQPMTESDKEAIRIAAEMYLLGKYGPKK